MVDNDLRELVQVLSFAPVFLELACDQMINGRIWNENYADLEAASSFITMAEGCLNETLKKGIKRRLQPVENFGYEEGKAYLETLVLIVQKLHSLIKAHYVRITSYNVCYTKLLRAVSMDDFDKLVAGK